MYFWVTDAGEAATLPRPPLPRARRARINESEYMTTVVGAV